MIRTSHLVAFALGAVAVAGVWRLDDRADVAERKLSAAEIALATAATLRDRHAAERDATIVALGERTRQRDFQSDRIRILLRRIDQDERTERDAPTAPVLSDSILGLQEGRRG